jgi:hypothetical protein
MHTPNCINFPFYLQVTVIDPADMDSLERALNENDVSLPSLVC